jgi:tetratricopeptide (TPR) repeat protein
MTRILKVATLCFTCALALHAQDSVPAAKPVVEESASESLYENLLYREAIQAANEYLPQVAATKFEQLLTQGNHFNSAARSELDEKLCESLVRSRQYEKVLEHTNTVENNINTEPVLLYWRAVALAEIGKYANAQTLLEKITAIPALASEPWFERALLTRVSILRALAATGEALSILQNHTKSNPITVDIQLQIAELQISLGRYDEAKFSLSQLVKISAKDEPRLRYLSARIALGEKRWDDASAAFLPLSKTKELQPYLRRASAIGLADALEGSARRKDATSLLLQTISENTQARGTDIFPMFERLDQMEYFATAEITPVLTEWSISQNTDLAAIAAYFVAVSQITAVSADAAITSFESFISAYPDHFLIDRTRLRLSELFTEAGDKGKALAALNELEKSTTDPAVTARITFLRAQADFAASEFKSASDKFAKASASSNSGARPAATFNAALAAMKAQGAAETLDNAVSAVESLNIPQLSGELQLERGLYHAQSSVVSDSLEKQSEATESAVRMLLDFISAYPDHLRAAEAHIALAGIFLNQLPTKAKSARAQLEQAKANNPTPRLQEEADYVAIWIEESDGNRDEVLKLSQLFRKKWPQSLHAPEVLMKESEIYLQKEDFTEARMHFDILADRFPNSPQAQPALFFAGKAAMRIGTATSLEEAINSWEKLAQKGGPLALVARQHQAIVKRIQKKDNEAIALFDAVLAADPKGDLLFSVLCAKGETMFRTAEPGADTLAPVIQVFEDALKLPDISTKWKNQCLYRLGESYEKAGNNAKALVSYYDCLNNWQSTTEQMPPGAYEWYYRCGQAAMRILESQENWPAAISIARRVGKFPGQRAQEALDHARQLELEHFIWDES